MFRRQCSLQTLFKPFMYVLHPHALDDLPQPLRHGHQLRAVLHKVPHCGCSIHRLSVAAKFNVH